MAIIGGTLGVGAFFLRNMFWVPLITAVLISGILIYFMGKSVHNFVNQSNVLKTLVRQRETELEGIRKEIEKNLYVKG